MKKVLTILILFVAFVFQTYATGLSAAGEHGAKGNTTINAFQTSLPAPDRNISDNSGMFLGSGSESIIVGFHFQLLKTPQRVFSSSNTGRIRNFKQLIRIQYVNLKKIRTTFLSYDQLSGYYLFQLRKLLI